MASARRNSKRLSQAGPKASVSLSVAVVGDGAVGKTSLVLAFLSGRYPVDYLPGPVDWHSEFDHLTKHPVKVEQEGVEISLTIVDTCGLDDYQKLREIVCASVDVYLVCFDVANKATLDRVQNQWVPEIRGYNSTAPFILVATKCDERIKAQIEGKPTSATVSFAQAKAIAQELGAHNYCECSAKNMTGLKKVFEEAALAGLHSTFPDGVEKNSGCVVS